MPISFTTSGPSQDEVLFTIPGVPAAQGAITATKLAYSLFEFKGADACKGLVDFAVSAFAAVKDTLAKWIRELFQKIVQAFSPEYGLKDDIVACYKQGNCTQATSKLVKATGKLFDTGSFDYVGAIEMFAGYLAAFSINQLLSQVEAFLSKSLETIFNALSRLIQAQFCGNPAAQPLPSREPPPGMKNPPVIPKSPLATKPPARTILIPPEPPSKLPTLLAWGGAATVVALVTSKVFLGVWIPKPGRR